MIGVGSEKIGKVLVGADEIGKVYTGQETVYQQKPGYIDTGLGWAAPAGALKYDTSGSLGTVSGSNYYKVNAGWAIVCFVIFTDNYKQPALISTVSANCQERRGDGSQLGYNHTASYGGLTWYINTALALTGAYTNPENWHVLQTPENVSGDWDKFMRWVAELVGLQIL